ncbi:MAG: hypothetical protein ACK551_04095 [Vampirovibrionales bacterium]
MINSINAQILQLGNEYSNAGTYYGITNDGYNAFGERANAQASQRNNLKRMHGNTFEGWFGDNLNLFRDRDDYSRHNLNEEMRLKREALLSALNTGISGDASAKIKLAKFGLELGSEDIETLKPQLQALKARIEASNPSNPNRSNMDMDAFSKEGGRDRLYGELSKLRQQYNQALETQQRQGLVDTQTLMAVEAVDTEQNLPASFKTHLQQSIETLQKEAEQNKGDLGKFSEWAGRLQEGVAKKGDGESGKAMRTATHDIMGQLNQRLQDLAKDGKSPQDILKAAFKGDPKYSEISAYIKLHQSLVGGNLPRNAEQVQAQVQAQRASRGFGLQAGTEVQGDRTYKLATGEEQIPQEVQTLKNGITIAKGYTVDKVDGNIATVSDGTHKYQYRTDVLAGGVRRTIVTALDENSKPVNNETAVYIQKQAPKGKEGKEVKKGNLYMVKGRNPEADKALVAQRDKTEQRAIALAKKEKDLVVPKPIIASVSTTPTTGSAASVPTSQRTAKAPTAKSGTTIVAKAPAKPAAPATPATPATPTKPATA